MDPLSAGLGFVAGIAVGAAVSTVVFGVRACRLADEIERRWDQAMVDELAPLDLDDPATGEDRHHRS